jgi:ketosteroid isomerase-like protein
MARPKPQVTNTPEDVEAAFYEALRKADIEALMACWADEDDIVCVHPGGPRFTGAGAIRASFDQIFQAAGGIDASIHALHRVHTLSTAVHSVVERVQIKAAESLPAEAHVIATNVYIKTALGWKLVVHHASPGTARETAEVREGPAVLH